MTNLDTTGGHSRTLTALFDTREAAQHATDELVAAGIPQQQIRLTAGGGSTAVAEPTTATETKGFWDELKDIFMPDEDRAGYAEGLRRGGYLLSVQVEDAHYNRVMDILDTDGAVDMDERESSWRSAGWSGYQAGSMGGNSTAAATDMSLASGLTAAPSATSVNSASAATKVDTLRTGADEVIPIYEETAQVAKRDVNHGRVRLRSYVVETPISQQVNLRNESVHVERRPVDRAISATDALFQDRVIEAEEHTEEAFITKEARVKEEISLRKTVEDRAQTVTDTVRHTEVDIEDGRGGRAVGKTGLTGAVDASLISEHMDVIASDGVRIGTVDHMEGSDKIKLARTTSPDGEHQYIPLAWVDHVDTHVHLTKTSTDAKTSW